MCIVILSTSHPDYNLVALSNRDEFLGRQTQGLYKWEDSGNGIYAGRDLGHPDKGTWLGITASGRFAVLTNVREQPAGPAEGLLSRGALVKSFLSFEGSNSIADWVNYQFPPDNDGNYPDLYPGFSLICGQIKNGDDLPTKLGIISNRSFGSKDAAGSKASLGKRSITSQDIQWVGGEKLLSCVCGLSNSPFGNSWPKVTDAEKLLSAAIGESVSQSLSEEDFVKKLFEILSTALPSYDTAPSDVISAGVNLSRTIFVPATSFAKVNLPSPSSTTEQQHLYGTRQQSVILVGKDGAVHFSERTIYDERGDILESNSKDRNRVVKFAI